MSAFANTPEAPPDAIFGVATKYNASKLEKKALLSVGVYRTEDGKPYVFPCVRKAEEKMLGKHSKDYLPMTGDAAFVKAAREFLWGPVLPEIADRTASIQSCAGTGALYLVARYVKDHLKVPKILLSNPTWANHKAIFSEQGLELGTYAWAKDCRLDIDACIKSLEDAPEGCVVLLQACAHNPTGIDPTPEQWKRILDAVKAKKHIPCFDFAYMGWASGDPDTDASVIRNFAKEGNFFFVCFSFSKCMGLYGERVGCVHAVCANAQEAKCVGSQFATIGRFTYSVCPQNGSYIATEVINDPELHKMWLEELKVISKRVIDIRAKFVQLLEQKTGKSFDFIAQQKGMFALTGLTPDEVKILGDEEGVFIPSNGRISVPALNNSNVEFVAQAVANVVAKRK